MNLQTLKIENALDNDVIGLAAYFRAGFAHISEQLFMEVCKSITPEYAVESGYLRRERLEFWLGTKTSKVTIYKPAAKLVPVMDAMQEMKMERLRAKASARMDALQQSQVIDLRPATVGA